MTDMIDEPQGGVRDRHEERDGRENREDREERVDRENRETTEIPAQQQADQPPPLIPAPYIPPHRLGSLPPVAPPPPTIAPPPTPAPAHPGPPDGLIALPQVPLQPAPDWWRAAAVALLNLSGLGIGYVLMRRWRAAVWSWIATAIFLLIALPATAGGVPIAITVIYLAILAVTAIHGAVRGLRTPLSWPPRSQLAFGLAVVLLAVPVGGTVLYDNAHQEAIQQMLLKRLTTADAGLATAETEPIATAETDFGPGLAAYRDLLDNHRTSRAGKLVPGRLAAFYQSVSAPYTKHDYCDAIEPLTYLRSLPSGTFSTQDLGSLAAFPDDPLATSLLQCGTGYLSGAGANLTTATQDLNLLMSTFPNSAQAGQVEPAVSNALGAAAGGITGSDPCTATDSLTQLSTQIKDLTSPVSGISTALQKDATTALADVESGSYSCAVSKYKGGDFAGAQTAMDSFVSTYPNDPNKALAQKYSIAAQIAQQDADAGKVTPTLTNSGSVSLTVSNDSPDPMQILYTGPATGTINIAACSGCKTYANATDGQQNACGNSSIDYPKTSLTLPPGTTFFLQKSTGTNVQSYAHSESYDAGSEYDVCAYETSLFSLPPYTSPIAPIVPAPGA
ncbi:hypothetical protein ABH926_006801 [Catenulispora sp. GP43]|uniref:hypothetical protein n=1 Tax=Catenulispora sp. GP43 TaxID=3156263 RepID=UPI003511E96F